MKNKMKHGKSWPHASSILKNVIPTQEESPCGLGREGIPPRRLVGMTIRAICLASAVWLVLFVPISQAQSELVILPGETQAGEVSNRRGQEWTFQGCADDVVTLTATSDDFVPFLALFDSTTEDALIEAEGDEDEQRAAITDFTLPSSDVYTLLVLGSSVLDRGDYELTLESSATTDVGATDLLIFPDQSVTGEVTDRFGSEIFFQGCADATVSFMLESDDFVPHLELFGPTGRQPLITDTANNAGAAAQISSFVLPETGLYLLVAAGENVRDRGEFSLTMLGVGEQPPTPTPTRTPPPTATPTAIPTATPTPIPTNTPTPAPQPSVLNPQGIVIQVNGGDGDLMGEIFMNPSYMISAFEEDDTLVVRDRFYLELFVFDIREGLFNGAGIDHVEFIFECPNGEQYVRIERSPRYCSFSDSGGSCNVLRLQSGTFFPGSACEITNDFYYVNVNAYPSNPELTPGNWNFTIRPEIP
jgi:hypothetical protein